MVDENTFYFAPNSFVDVMKTDLGDRVMRAIISNKSTKRMKLAVSFGLAPVTGCIHVLQDEIDEEELSSLRIKQFIGIVVKQYMEFLGYHATGKKQRVRKPANKFIKQGKMFEKDEAY